MTRHHSLSRSCAKRRRDSMQDRNGGYSYVGSSVCMSITSPTPTNQPPARERSTGAELECIDWGVRDAKRMEHIHDRK
jgi:hypothetical protein